MTIAQHTLQLHVDLAFARLESLTPGFENRPGQREMAARWSDVLDEGGILAIEAPTGIGKSLAYLIPALAHRARGSGPILVSTHTKNLQDQLLREDVPAASRALGAAPRVTVLKGRSSYLCRRRADARLAQGRLFGEDDERSGGALASGARAALEAWIGRTTTGELGELAATGHRFPAALLADIASDPFVCAGAGCDAATGCFAKAARRDARRADLVIVNHALLLSDPGVRGAMVAESGALVLDEAHHLERVARDQMGVSIGVQDVARLAARTDAKSGALRQLTRALRRGTRSAETAAAVAAADRSLRHVLAHAAAFTRDLARILPAGAASALWPRGVDVAAVSPEALDLLLAAIAETTRALERAIDAAEAGDGAAMKPASASAEALDEVRGRLGQWREVDLALRSLARVEDRDVATYVDRDERGGPRLNRRPLEVGPALASTLFGLAERTLLTSATLSAGIDLAPALARLGIASGDADAARIASPFPLERQMAAVALDGPDPTHPRFAESLAGLVLHLAESLRRNTLVLLTSYQMLEEVAARLEGPLARGGIPLFTQAPGEAAAPLARAFRSGSGGVLLGTASFWEGVDFPGEALEVLVIARLPFPVPTDPVVEARSERIAEEGGDPFRDLMLPEAALRFRQGVGRLIRTASDRGAVVIADPRIVRASYRERFAAALPVPPRVVGSPAEASEHLARWFS